MEFVQKLLRNKEATQRRLLPIRVILVFPSSSNYIPIKEICDIRGQISEECSYSESTAASPHGILPYFTFEADGRRVVPHMKAAVFWGLQHYKESNL